MTLRALLVLLPGPAPAAGNDMAIARSSASLADRPTMPIRASPGAPFPTAGSFQPRYRVMSR